jgi:transposase-like protein
LDQVPAHDVIVSHGGSGIAATVWLRWPETKTQRCVFHIQMNVRQQLTLWPRAGAGRTLLGLSRALSAVKDVDQAVQWEPTLNARWQRHGHLTKERTRDG